MKLIETPQGATCEKTVLPRGASFPRQCGEPARLSAEDLGGNARHYCRRHAPDWVRDLEDTED